ncbi:MAG: CRISPR-associated endonuclease Cas1 [Planctomycetaceae bacterium]
MIDSVNGANERRPRSDNPQLGIGPDAPQNATASIDQAGQTACDNALPELIPVRMLNEFTYCPRLGYLEWVDGEWASNLETMEGTFGHRRVDKPDRKTVESPVAKEQRDEDSPPEPIHARSLELSAPVEGLIAKLDLAEVDSNVATPVDYKRGKAPKIPEGAYEPERVQLCAQGLILRENGFQCDSGVLYFIASKQRVTIEFTDALIARTRELRDEFRRTAAAGQLPPPLVDSPKCPRCSLVGICLPDETNLLTETPVPLAGDPPRDHGRVRKLLPARDDALPLYLQAQGATLGKSGDRLTIKERGELVGERRVMDVSQVSLFGNVMVTAQALRELNTRGIPVCHFSYGGWFHGMTTGLVHKNVELRIRQFQIAADADAALKIARPIISGKIRNSRTLLRRHLAGDSPLTLDQLDDYRRKAERATTAVTLLGLEGMAAKTYFSGFFQLLNNRHGFDVNGRNRRPPRDPVNAVLSFVYSLLVKELTVVLQGIGFDPMLGFLHQPRYGRPSLALDAAEEYRPLIADSVALMVFNNGEVDERSFIQRAGAVTMTDSGRKTVIAAFERRLQQEVTHPTFGYRVSYRRILEVQMRLLARTVTGELSEYVPFCTR